MSPSFLVGQVLCIIVSLYLPYNLMNSNILSIYCRTLISQFLKAIRNTHASIPRDKIDFILTVLNSSVKLLHSAGRCLGDCVCVCGCMCACMHLCAIDKMS